MAMNRTIAVATLLVATTAFAQTEVPHDFESGQPARASEVNENFDALEAGINANSADIQDLQDAQGSPDPSAPMIFDLEGDWTTPAPEIDVPGLYLLGRDLRDPDGEIQDPALVISANNVTLDLGGRSLNGYYLGLLVTGNNVIVRNGRISGESGIESNGARNVFEDLIVSGGISIAGDDSVVRNSRTSANQQYGGGIYALGNNALVEGNRIEGLETGLLVGELAQGARIIDNYLECQTLGFSDCLYVRGDANLIIRNQLFSLDTATINISGSRNLVSDNIVLNNKQPGSTAFTIEGTANIIRSNLVMPTGEPWATGILFTQDGNYYGNNQVSALAAFVVGGTTQTDLGGNVQF
jgi:hypothetical protein